jgi:hypothetical protein
MEGASVNEPKTISGEEFRLHLLELAKAIKDDDRVYFGSGDLSLSRVKERGPVDGPRLVQIEFTELYRITHEPSAS